MKYKSVQILGDRLWVRKCFNDHYRDENGKIVIYRTDYSADTTNWAEIIDVGPKCKIFSKSDIGSYVMCPEHDSGLKRLFDEDFAVKESSVLPLVVEK